MSITVKKRLMNAAAELQGTYRSNELADKVNFDGTGGKSLSPGGAAKIAHQYGIIEEAGRLNNKGGRMTKVWRSRI